MNNFKFMLISIVALFVMSCDKSDDTPGISINDFKGSWTATSAIYTNNANPAEQIDMITLGGSIDFTMLEDGATRTWFTLGTYHDEWDAVVTLTDQSNMISDPVEPGRETRMMSFTLVDDVLTLTYPEAEFDFSLMGEPPVSATSVVVFVPN